MASLRTAFLQTYQTGHNCFCFFTSFSFLLTLTCDDRSAAQEPTSPLTPRQGKLTSSFRNISDHFKKSQQRASWLSGCTRNSLLQIADKENSDFGEEKEGSSFVHALEVIDSLNADPQDITTVVSEEISIGDVDPNSTRYTNDDSDLDFSEVVDI